MDKNVMIAIGAIAVIAIAAVGVYVVISGNHDNVDTPSSFDDVGLKVYGNVNGDNVIDRADIDMLERIVNKGMTVEEAPLADANQDKVLNSKDVETVTKIVNGESTVIWHVNYHDSDGDSVMDEEIVSTKFPVTSMIMTGSANSFMLCYMLDIIDEVKGASYGSTNDKSLYKYNYLDEEKTVKLGTSSTTITFEDGKAGSSDVIAEENVTCVLSDWNRSYLTNEDKFEAANIDVVRVAAASVDKEVYTHSILLLGLLFQKHDKSIKLLELYDDAFDGINSMIAKLPVGKAPMKGIASSMTGYVSSGTSDYQDVLNKAGMAFGLEGFDFGSSTSIKVVDNEGIFNTDVYSWQRIVHLRTAVYYDATAESISKIWKSYTEAFNEWEHYGEDGSQVIVSGAIPVPVRVAYTLLSSYGGQIEGLDLAWANAIHQSFINLFHDGNQLIDVNKIYTYVDKDPMAA